MRVISVLVKFYLNFKLYFFQNSKFLNIYDFPWYICIYIYIVNYKNFRVWTRLGSKWSMDLVDRLRQVGQICYEEPYYQLFLIQEYDRHLSNLATHLNHMVVIFWFIQKILYHPTVIVIQPLVLMSAYIEVPAAVNLEFYLFKWPVHESITKFN